MPKQTRVLLYGESLVLAGMEAILNREPSLEVIARALISENELRAVQPDVIIYDTSTLQPGFQFLLAQELPDILLIGVNPENNQMQVWSSRTLYELSGDDLIAIILSLFQK
jgi:hypothetical protein